MKSKVIAIAFSLILIPAAVLADERAQQSKMVVYNGPVELTSVASLLENTSLLAEKDVILEGYIIRQTRKDEFVFTDGEGEIQIELDDDIELVTPVNDKSKVRIYGEYEGGRTPEIEVEDIQIL